MKLSLILPLALCFRGGAALAAPEATSGAVIDLTDVRMRMVSTIDGSPLPVNRMQSSWSLGTQVRSGERIDEHYVNQPYADYYQELPVRVGSLLDSGYATVRIAQMYGDIHAAGGFSNYVRDEHVAYANANMAAYFVVPGHARLTLSGHVTVSSAGDLDKDYASFSSLFALQGLVSDSFALEHANAADQDFTITALNPYDGPSWFYQVTSLNLFAFAPPSPVPEAPKATMLAAGLLIGWRWRCRKSGSGRPACWPIPPGHRRQSPTARSHRT